VSVEKQIVLINLQSLALLVSAEKQIVIINLCKGFALFVSVEKQIVFKLTEFFFISFEKQIVIINLETFALFMSFSTVVHLLYVFAH